MCEPSLCSLQNEVSPAILTDNSLCANNNSCYINNANHSLPEYSLRFESSLSSLQAEASPGSLVDNSLHYINNTITTTVDGISGLFSSIPRPVIKDNLLKISFFQI